MRTKSEKGKTAQYLNNRSMDFMPRGPRSKYISARRYPKIEVAFAFTLLVLAPFSIQLVLPLSDCIDGSRAGTVVPARFPRIKIYNKV